MAGTIKVTIDHLGRPKIEAEGFTGSSCMAATSGIEAALGAKAGDTELKPEYYATEQVAEEQAQF